MKLIQNCFADEVCLFVCLFVYFAKFVFPRTLVNENDNWITSLCILKDWWLTRLVANKIGG